MINEVVLSPLATTNYENIVNYLNSNWGSKTASDFIRVFENKMLLISQNPGIYTVVETGNHIQRCVVTKHNTIYFKANKNQIVILMIFDNRQDPDKLFDLLNLFS